MMRDTDTKTVEVAFMHKVISLQSCKITIQESHIAGSRLLIILAERRNNIVGDNWRP